jgi:hypothetical protein
MQFEGGRERPRCARPRNPRLSAARAEGEKEVKEKKQKSCLSCVHAFSTPPCHAFVSLDGRKQKTENNWIRTTFTLIIKITSTHKAKIHQVVKSRGQDCGDIELVGYLTDVAGPVPLVLDLRVAHDRVDSSADPALNEHLRYPNILDQSLNDTSTTKLRKYRVDYNFNPPRGVGFMSAIPSTSGHLHGEFIRILFLQTHRETDRFFVGFRSYVFSIRSWIFPLPPRGFFFYAQI